MGVGAFLECRGLIYAAQQRNVAACGKMLVHPYKSATCNQKCNNGIEHPIPEKPSPQVVGVECFVVIVGGHTPSPDDP